MGTYVPSFQQHQAHLVGVNDIWERKKVHRYVLDKEVKFTSQWLIAAVIYSRK